MAKWCNQYNCFCSDLESILDEEDIDCDQDCNSCEYMEKIEQSH